MMDRYNHKVAESAVAFLIIFLLIHGILDKEFVERNWHVFKAFGLTRVLLIGLLLTE